MLIKQDEQDSQLGWFLNAKMCLKPKVIKGIIDLETTLHNLMDW